MFLNKPNLYLLLTKAAMQGADRCGKNWVSGVGSESRSLGGAVTRTRTRAGVTAGKAVLESDGAANKLFWEIRKKQKNENKRWVNQRTEVNRRQINKEGPKKPRNSFINNYVLILTCNLSHLHRTLVGCSAQSRFCIHRF